MHSYHLITRSGIKVQHGVNVVFSRSRSSINSAINAGLRKAAGALKSAETRRIKEGHLTSLERDDPEKAEAARTAYRDARRQEIEQKKRLAFLRDDSVSASQGDRFTMNRSARPRSSAVANGVLLEAPSAMPYTIATSEFVYGTFSVISALEANRRTLYQLYIWCGELGEAVDNDEETQKIVQLANKAKIPIKRVGGAWEKMLSKMADGRPHNGFILEAAAIPKTTIKSLAVVKHGDTTVEYELLQAEQASAETSIQISRATDKRFPLLLWLDKIKDTGNMGAIIRTAYYLGVEGIILPNHGTAPLNAVTIKSSAGAAEYLPVLTIDHELNFMDACQKNGWKFFAAGSLEGKSAGIKMSRSKQSKVDLNPYTVLDHHPAVIMLGSEDEGLRPILQNKADMSVSIKPGRKGEVLDSLNVSVAAALLTQRFLSGKS